MEYHAQSLANLGVAMHRTKRLCATILDTVGREIMIIRPYSLNEVRPPGPPRTSHPLSSAKTPLIHGLVCKSNWHLNSRLM